MKRSIIAITICLFCQTLLLSQKLELKLDSCRNDFYKTYSVFHKDTALYNDLHPRTRKGLDRWEWFWSSRVDASGKYDRYYIEMRKYIKDNEKFWGSSAKKSAPVFSWETLGPKSRPTNTYYGSSSTVGQGRFNTLWVDPDNLNHIIAGSNNGGLWETWNAENPNPDLITWSNITDPYCVGGISDIAVHPTNKDIIYFTTKVGTGGIVRDLLGRYSLGLFKSTDSGSTWNLSFPSSNISELKRIKIHPTNSSILYLLGSRGVAVSYNSGSTWNSTSLEDDLSGNQYLEEIEFMPGNPSTVYVSGKNSLYKTTNGGGKWTPLLSSLNPIYTDVYISISVNQSIPSDLYAYYCNYGDGGFNYSSTIYKHSSNGGVSWNPDVTITDNYLGQPYVAGIWTAYDQDIFLGGVYISKYPSYGSYLSSNSIHPDIRDCYFLNSYNNYIYVANDGGIYKSTSDGANWKRLTGNIAANEFYDIGVTEANPEMIIGGTQDGGTYIRDGSGSWDLVSGGDGNNSLIDQADTNYFYSSATRSVYRRRLPKDSAAVYIQTFYKIGNTIGMDPKNSGKIYMIDESPIDNKLRLQSSANRGLSWSDLDQIYREMTDMEFCYDIPNSFYIITYDPWWKANSELYFPLIYPPSRVFYSNDGGNNLNQVSYTGIGSVLDDTPILSASVHPYTSTKLWITLGGFEADNKVYFSEDGGNSWSNITGSGLPNLPIQCIEYDFLNDYLYVGTDVGIFYKSLSSTLWVAADGIPKTIITDIELNKASGDLVVGTFGRGVYRTNLGEGYCKTTGNPIIIENSAAWSIDSEYCEDIIVAEDGHLTISGKATMSFESTITVEGDGILTIDGGEIINGNIIVEDGGTLQLVNNGNIFQNYEDELSIESGGILDILEGEIENVEQ